MDFKIISKRIIFNFKFFIIVSSLFCILCIWSPKNTILWFSQINFKLTTKAPLGGFHRAGTGKNKKVIEIPPPLLCPFPLKKRLTKFSKKNLLWNSNLIDVFYIIIKNIIWKSALKYQFWSHSNFFKRLRHHFLEKSFY